jgi:putative inorganic carbon (hco3(-)) transporter
MIDGNPALLATVALVILLVLLRRPETGTLMAAAILYLNLLPIGIRYHHLHPVFAIATAALVVPALLQYWVVNHDRLLIDRPFLLMVAFLGSTIMSSLFSKNSELSLSWIAGYVTQGMLTYLLLINLIRSREALRRLAWVLVLCGGFLAALTVYQEVTGSYTNDFGGLATRRTVHGERLEEGPATGPATKGMRRAHGPDLDANRYAQILIVLLPLAWCLMRNGTSLRGKAAAAACALLILGGVLLTYSRGAFVGLVAMLVLMGLLRAISVRQALLAGAVVLVSMVVLSPGYVERMETLRGIEGLVGPASESQVEVERVARTRATVMIVAWRVFRDHPILGVGPDQFAALYVVPYGAELDLMDIMDRHFAAHSLYLQLAAETGLVGLGVFMSIVIASLARLAEEWRRMRAIDRSLADWAAATLVAIATYMVTGVFLHFTYQRYFWILVGLGGAAVQLCRTEHGKEVEALSPALPRTR